MIGFDLQKKRNSILDQIKGMCAVMVIITHSSFFVDSEGYVKGFLLNSSVPIFLFLSGYLYYKSFQKVDSFADYRKWIIKKITHFLIPYTIGVGLEIVVYALFSNSKTVGSNYLMLFLLGGIGPGSYYNLIILQLILFFPIIYMLIDRHDVKAVYYLFFTNLIYELAQRYFQLDESIYRLLIFRYIFVISMGSFYSCKRYTKNSIIRLISLVLGLFYVLRIINNDQLFVFSSWAGTSMFACLLWIPVVEYYIEKVKYNNKISELIGLSSYNVFLTQMVYYAFEIEEKLKINNAILIVVLNIIICCGSGFVFYLLSNRIDKEISNQIDKL